MGVPPTTTQPWAIVHVSHHQLFLAAEGRHLAGPPPANGLVGRCGSGAVVYTGIHTGPILVTVEPLHAPPPVFDWAWEEIADIALDAGEGPVRVAVLMADVPDALPMLNAFGPGRYGVRVHATGRDLDIDGAPDSPSETYLIQSWPDRDATDVVHKPGGVYAESVRRQARAEPDSPTVPGPAPLDDAAQAAHERLLRSRRERGLE